jgi:hypothetical protein
MVLRSGWRSNLATLSPVRSRPYWQNTRSRSRSSTASQSVLTECNGTLNRCESRWRPGRSELTDVTAKVVIYEAFVGGKLEGPKHLARTVHDLYFEPKYEEFQSRTIWSLSNAFTSAFKELDPIPQFKATAKLGEILDARFSQSF